MGFFNAYAFALTPLAALIILLYLIKARPQKKTLSSTRLWRLVMMKVKTNSIWQHFRSSLFLFLQLLALGLGIFALARPYLKSGIYGDAIFVIDCTASMGATDVSPNRYEVARKGAIDALGRVGKQTRVLIASYGKMLRVELPYTSDRGKANAVMRLLKHSDESGAGSEALWSFLANVRTKKTAQIHIFTDTLSVVRVPKAFEGARIHVHSYGSSEENFALTTLQIERVTAKYEVAAGIANLGRSTTLMNVELYQKQKVIARREVSLAPGVEKAVLFEDISLKPGIIKVCLRPVGGDSDYLLADNEATAIVETGGLRVILVSRQPNPVLLRLLTLNPALRLRQMSPGDAANIVAQPCDFFILDRYWDPAFSGRSYFLFASETGAGEWRKSGASINAPKISFVDGTHPLTRYLRFAGVTIRRAVALKLLDKSHAVVRSDRGPLVAIRELAAARQVVCAFNLTQTNFPLRVGFPIFMTNALRWLAGRDIGAATFNRPGDLLRLAPAGNKVVVKSKEGTRILTAPGNGRSLLLKVFDRTGLVKIHYDGSLRSFAVNLLDVTESRIKPLNTASQVVQPSKKVSAGRSSSSLWQIFAIACLIVVLAEWTLYCVKGA